MAEPRSEAMSSRQSAAGWFATTHWSVVLAAADSSMPSAQEALERLCRTYWPPLYAYIRRCGHSPQEAEDLTQEFFARLLEKNFLGLLRHREGKFRSFLLTLLKHFLTDERDKARAQKRGGGQRPISLDALSAEERYRLEPATESSAEKLFDRQWARTVLEQAAQRLAQEYAAAGKRDLFDQLKDLQPDVPGQVSYQEIGARLGLSLGAVTSAVHRLRRRYREILHEEIAHTVSRPEQIGEEINYLIAVLSG